MGQEVRTCRSCGSVERVVGVVCPHCGPTVGLHAGSDGAKSLVCERCRGPVKPPSGIVPAVTCAACGASGFGSCDAAGRWSSTSLEEQPGQRGRWVKVEFDGVYQGTDPTASGASHTSGRAFAVTLLDSVFSNAVFVDAPPSVTGGGDTPPIREAAVSGVLVFDAPSPDAPGAGQHPGGPFKVTLSDFRLHDWRHLSEETPIGRMAGTHGRLKGTGYGRLDLAPDPPLTPKERAPENASEYAPERTTPEVPPVAPNMASAVTHTDRVRTGVNRLVERAAVGLRIVLPPPLWADSTAVRDCPACNPTGAIVSALVMWLLCSWRAALVTLFTLRFACTVHRWLCHWGIGLHGVRRPWSTVVNLAGGLPAIWLALLALQKAIMAAPSASCGSWFFPGYRTFLLALILCGLLPARWPRRVVTLLFLWALLVSCRSAGQRCGIPLTINVPGIGLPGVSVPGGSVPGGGLPSLPSVPSNLDLPPVDAPMPSLPQQLAQSLTTTAGDIAGDVTAAIRPDPTAELLQGLSSGTSGGFSLVSVSQVRREPDRYLGCFPDSTGQSGPMYGIYLGSDAFFEFDSDRLKPTAAEASLRELLVVFEARPASRFVVTGHADTTGTPHHNLDLSRRRAQAITDWLIAHGVAPSRVEIVAAGSSTPLIRPVAPVAEGGYLSGAAQVVLAPALINRINRRVEITIDCPPPGGSR